MNRMEPMDWTVFFFFSSFRSDGTNESNGADEFDVLFHFFFPIGGTEESDGAESFLFDFPIVR